MSDKDDKKWHDMNAICVCGHPFIDHLVEHGWGDYRLAKCASPCGENCQKFELAKDQSKAVPMFERKTNE